MDDWDENRQLGGQVRNMTASESIWNAELLGYMYETGLLLVAEGDYCLMWDERYGEPRKDQA